MSVCVKRCAQVFDDVVCSDESLNFFFLKVAELISIYLGVVVTPNRLMTDHQCRRQRTLLLLRKRSTLFTRVGLKRYKVKIAFASVKSINMLL